MINPRKEPEKECPGKTEENQESVVSREPSGQGRRQRPASQKPHFLIPSSSHLPPSSPVTPPRPTQVSGRGSQKTPASVLAWPSRSQQDRPSFPVQQTHVECHFPETSSSLLQMAVRVTEAGRNPQLKLKVTCLPYELRSRSSETNSSFNVISSFPLLPEVTHHPQGSPGPPG